MRGRNRQRGALFIGWSAYETLAAMKLALEPLTEFQLTGLHNGMTLTGSAVMALALTEVPSRAEELWTAAHLDEDWQIELWGKDEEALLPNSVFGGGDFYC